MDVISSKKDGRFPNTEWTLVRRLRHQDTHVCKRALNELCTLYHYPLYCFIRQRGLSHHDAEDALHDFLAKLLRLDALTDLAAEKGRLRTFLSKTLQRFLINLHHQQKTRIDTEVLRQEANFPLDPKLEQRYEREMGSTIDSPDVAFDRRWCEELLQRVVRRLESEYAEKGKQELFAALLPVLVSGGSLRDHDSEELASKLSMTPGAVRAALLRLLRDYRGHLVGEVRQTVDARDDVEQEIACLMDAVRT